MKKIIGQRTFYIYKYTNKINGKIYIGQTIDLEARDRSHKSSVKNNIESSRCPYFYRAAKKHGWDNFEKEILETIFGTQEDCDIKEKFWISKLDAMNSEIGYNISPGGGGRANPNNTDTHKWCSRCEKLKLRNSDFNIDIHRHDKLYQICRECFNTEQQEIRDSLSPEEREEINAKRREKYNSNEELRQKIIQAVKKNYEENKDEINSKRKDKYYNDPKFKVKIQEKNHEQYLKNEEERKQKEKIARKKNKEKNLQRGNEAIYAATPVKFCKDCGKEIPSSNFYIDLNASNGLSRLCKEHQRQKTAANKLKKSNKVIQDVVI